MNLNTATPIMNASTLPHLPLNASVNGSLSGIGGATDYYYYYDYDASVSQIPLEELVPVALVYGLTLVLGVLGNGLVIFAIARNRRMQTVTNMFLVSLASADLLIVVMCVPIKFAKFMTFTWEFGEALCKLVHYMQNVSVICSVLTLTVMSLERYYAILHPMRARYVCTRARARKAILGVWLSSFVLATPILIGQIHKEVGTIRVGFWCVKEWEEPAFSKTYEVGMLLLIFTIPIAIISFAYINICKELWHMTSQRNSLRAEKKTVTNGTLVTWQPSKSNKSFRHKTKTIRHKVVDENSTRKQVIKMLVLVIILFALCWGPLLIDNVLVAFGVLEYLNYGYLKYMRQAFSLMAYANSCVNPIVYAFMSRNFRESFVNSLCACVKGESYRRRHQFLRQVSGAETRVTSLCGRNSLLTQIPDAGTAGIELKTSPCRTRLISTEALIATDNEIYSDLECNL